MTTGFLDLDAFGRLLLEDSAVAQAVSESIEAQQPPQASPGRPERTAAPSEGSPFGRQTSRMVSVPEPAADDATAEVLAERRQQEAELLVRARRLADYYEEVRSLIQSQFGSPGSATGAREKRQSAALVRKWSGIESEFQETLSSVARLAASDPLIRSVSTLAGRQAIDLHIFSDPAFDSPEEIQLARSMGLTPAQSRQSFEFDYLPKREVVTLELEEGSLIEDLDMVEQLAPLVPFALAPERLVDSGVITLGGDFFGVVLGLFNLITAAVKVTMVTLAAQAAAAQAAVAQAAAAAARAAAAAQVAGARAAAAAARAAAGEVAAAQAAAASAARAVSTLASVVPDAASSVVASAPPAFRPPKRLAKAYERAEDIVMRRETDKEKAAKRLQMIIDILFPPLPDPLDDFPWPDLPPPEPDCEEGTPSAVSLEDCELETWLFNPPDVQKLEGKATSYWSTEGPGFPDSETRPITFFTDEKWIVRATVRDAELRCCPGQDVSFPVIESAGGKAALYGSVTEVTDLENGWYTGVYEPGTETGEVTIQLGVNGERAIYFDNEGNQRDLELRIEVLPRVASFTLAAAALAAAPQMPVGARMTALAASPRVQAPEWESDTAAATPQNVVDLYGYTLGNMSRSKRELHVPTCSYIHLIHPRNLVPFRSLEDGHHAGLDNCHYCIGGSKR